MSSRYACLRCYCGHAARGSSAARGSNAQLKQHLRWLRSWTVVMAIPRVAVVAAARVDLELRPKAQMRSMRSGPRLAWI